jgi:hypothetical protein
LVIASAGAWACNLKLPQATAVKNGAPWADLRSRDRSKTLATTQRIFSPPFIRQGTAHAATKLTLCVSNSAAKAKFKNLDIRGIVLF